LGEGKPEFKGGFNPKFPKEKPLKEERFWAKIRENFKVWGPLVWVKIWVRP